MFIAERIISIVAPHRCLSCDAEGSLLCAWCSADALEPLPSRCYKCSKKTLDFEVCQTHRRLSPLKHVWVASEYEGLAKDLIGKLKFERASTAASTIAQLLDDNMPVLSREMIVTHLPTATTRRRQRGYDQAQLIASSFANIRKVSYASLLARKGQSRQVGAKREERLKQAQDSYYVPQTKKIKRQHILLIDDIVTTGASLESAAKALKKAGAKQVDALVFASAK